MIQINQTPAQDGSQEKVSHSELKLLRANSQYSETGNHNYFVDECFKNTDIIVPVEMINVSALSDPTKNVKEICDKVDIMSLSTMHSDNNSRRNSSDSKDSTDFSAIMMKRWESHVQ